MESLEVVAQKLCDHLKVSEQIDTRIGNLETEMKNKVDKSVVMWGVGIATSIIIAVIGATTVYTNAQLSLVKDDVVEQKEAMSEVKTDVSWIKDLLNSYEIIE